MSRLGYYDEKDGFVPYDDCQQEKPKPSNADRIRAMTDEELAHWIVEMKITGCPEDQFSTMWCDDMSCVDCWLDWLKQECDDTCS